MENNSMDLVHGAAIYEQDNFSVHNNMTPEDFLILVLGPKQQEDKNLLWFMTIFYGVVFLSGLFGNLSVIIVIVKSKGLHCAMNYYLISLAMADILIILLGVPNELSVYWHQYPYPFGELFCKIRSFLSEGASYASVLTILSFSLERYLAICSPLYIFPMSDFRRACLVSSLCWTVAILASVPHLLFTKLNYVDFPIKSGNFLEDSSYCAMLDENIYPKGYPVHELSFLIFYAIPIFFLTFFYTCMINTIRKANTGIRRSAYRASNASSKATDHRKQTIRMLVSVVFLFFVSWTPFHFQRLGYVYFKSALFFRTVNQYLFYFSGILYYLSSTLNPLLYTLMSVKYRQAFKNVMLCRTSNSYTAVFTTNRTTLDTQLSTEKNFKIRRISQSVSGQNNNAEINGQRQKITETCFD